MDPSHDTDITPAGHRESVIRMLTARGCSDLVPDVVAMASAWMIDQADTTERETVQTMHRLLDRLALEAYGTDRATQYYRNALADVRLRMVHEFLPDTPGTVAELLAGTEEDAR